MNQPQLPPKVDDPLDRRAALVVLAGLLLIVPLVVPLVGKELGERFLGTVVKWPMAPFTNAWLMASCACVGFYAAFGPGLRVLRFALSAASCLWIVFFYKVGRALAAGPPGDEGALSYWIAILLMGEIAAGLAAFRALTKCRLDWRGRAGVTRNRYGQFRIKDLMLLTLVLSLTLGPLRWLGDFAIPPWQFFLSWRFWTDIFIPVTMFAALAVCSILAAFSRMSLVMLLISAAAITSADSALFLAIYIPINQWTNVAEEAIGGALFLKLLFVVCCIGTQLILRWLGYEIRPPATVMPTI